MPDWLQNLVRQFSALSPARQAVLVLTTVGSLAFFYWISNGTHTGDYRLLYRGLEEMEIAQIAEALTAERIDFQIAEGGTAIRVPGAKVPEARMKIASRGLPNGSSPGFEIFDQGAFGVTDFVQKVNYQRALQGELARTIEQVEGVEKARVQLVVPKRRSLLRKADRAASASVVTRLRPGWTLDPGQVRGIVHLVASSVEGLDVTHVTLVDNHGRLLAPQGDMDTAGRSAGPAFRAGRRVEAELERQVESILERTVGPGRVVAKVRADFDWTRTERTEEIYDPDSQVARSTQVEKESASESSREGGVAGITANTPDVATASGAVGSGTASTRTSETTNFEINKVVSHHVLPTGRIERLSIAVLVDGKPVAAASGKAVEDGDPTGQGAFEPWSEDELLELESLAKRAVGFSAERGDEISVINAPFAEIDVEDDGGAGGFLTPDVLLLLTSVLRGVAYLIGLLLFAKFFIRPLAEAVGGGDDAAIEDLREEVMARLASVSVESVDEEDGEGIGLGGVIRDSDIPGLDEGNDGEITLEQQVDRLAQRRTEDSVRTIRGWMASGG
ncbi:MAG TPA: flagellar M-ring protein FliF [Deltaproteobacteria bacterium]|nr:flagellar M-ring protein FliF [Deltaproteobacteria bacterium]